MLPRLETVLRTLAFVPDFQTWREEIYQRPGPGERPQLLRYIKIAQSLHRLQLYNASVLELDPADGYLSFCLSISMASHVTVISANPLEELKAARQLYDLRHLEIIPELPSDRAWDIVLSLNEPHPRLTGIARRVAYVSLDPALPVANARSLGLSYSDSGQPQVLWELQHDA